MVVLCKRVLCAFLTCWGIFAAENLSLPAEKVPPFFDYDCDLAATSGAAATDWDAVHAASLLPEGFSAAPGAEAVAALLAGHRHLVAGGAAAAQAEAECPLGVLYLRVLAFYEKFRRREGGQSFREDGEHVQRLLQSFPVYAIALSRWRVFHALAHFERQTQLEEEELPEICCRGVVGLLDWTALREDAQTWIDVRHADCAEVEARMAERFFTILRTASNQLQAEEECQFGFYFLIASQVIAASNKHTRHLPPFDNILQSMFASHSFPTIAASGWPILMTLRIFADLNKGQEIFVGVDRKYLRVFADWDLRRDELSPLLGSGLDFLSAAWRAAAQGSVAGLLPLARADYVGTLRARVRQRENVDGPLRPIVRQLVDVAIEIAASTPPGVGHRLVYMVLLYGKEWSKLLERLARRFHQLGMQYPLLVIAIGPDAGAACKALSSNRGGGGRDLGKVICWSPVSTSQVHRFTAMHALLHLGIDIIYLDMDTFMLRDPGPRILQQAEGKDAAFARHADADCINIGVFFVRAGPRTAVWFSQFIAWYHDHPFEIDQRGLHVFLGLPAQELQIAYPPPDLVAVRGTVLEDVNEIIIAGVGWYGHISKLLIVHWCQVPVGEKMGPIMAAYDAADAVEKHGLPLTLAVAAAFTAVPGSALSKVLEFRKFLELAEKSSPPERSPCW